MLCLALPLRAAPALCLAHAPHHHTPATLQDGSGRISLRKLQAFASKHGGETLTLADLRQLFSDFEPRGHDASVGEAEFLRFFSRVSATMANREFGEMIQEMQG